ncbi:L-threonylcarbamoyladenylate synthase [Jeongeupia naejangsanensis]|uniref:Threonylcarbamoyl-AMP synthase n=1 Tax=Jeongeupia naejangsanensis TaxID=613195 RepID=A0ABS2BGT6_9NEIS|nr:L-threonylcarbamoyladenylate synthase [Jeongeupia naejangsanensis]MBM3114680.1 threonylcarbamoyl-AMP synthase [Jeongeupia naejangsanensis]
MNQLDHAVALLRQGELVAIPTETVYGLAADAANPNAVAKIFALKGRPSDHPLIVHIAGTEQLDDWAVDIPADARRLAEAFWPGPLTLILKRHPRVPDAVTGGQDTVGLRAPAHPLAHALLTQFGGGLAAPSANRFGHVSPTTAQHVLDEFGESCPLVLDGGASPVGVESTIVSLIDDTPKLLRPGGIAREAIEAVLGHELEHHESNKTAKIRASGLLDSHYAPRTPLILGPLPQLLEEAGRRLADGERVLLLHRTAITASIDGITQHTLAQTAQQFASELYALLRQHDRQYDILLMETPPSSPEWLAVNDRLKRAATRRLP